MQMENQRTIKVSDFVYALRKHRRALVLLVAVALLLGIELTVFSRYHKGAKNISSITASFAVTAENSQGGYSSNHTEPQSQDIYLAENMVDAVRYVCTSDEILEVVRSKLMLPNAVMQDIYANLSIQQYKKTQIVELSLRWPDPEEGIDILTELTKAVPDVLLKTLGLGNIFLVNEPKAALVSQQWNLQYPAAAVILAVAAGFVFILSRLCVHPTLINPANAQHLFGLETLAEVPLDSAIPDGMGELSVLDEAASSDFYRNGIAVAAHRLVSQLQETPTVLIVTSAMPGEGKTEITANLGARLSELGKRVLLIDLNLQSPNLSKRFLHQPKCKHSLNAAHQGEIPVQEAVFSLAANLDLVSSLPEHDKSLINERLQEIIETLKKDYDYVLVDTASVGQEADTLQIARMADEAIFVIRHDHVWVDVIQSCIGTLRSSGVDIFGGIVNGVSEYGSSFNLYCRKAGITGGQPGGGKQ